MSGHVWAGWAEAWPARREERGEVVDGLTLDFARWHLPHGALLDAGCGDGWYAGALHSPSHQVTGVDATPGLLAAARREHPQVPFVEASLSTLPFADGTFDGTFCLTVLEWVNDPLAALRELRRVTKQDGRLVLGLLGAGNRTRDLHAARFWGESPMNGLLPWELPLLCDRVGWRVHASRGVSRGGWVDGERDAMTRAMLWLFALRRDESTA